ncbi:MAG: hypothetical protein LBM93_12375, partial [Oscillospiraceae bacterium]|nr:hypothetical protein [Oscillospiraceae bacterium]
INIYNAEVITNDYFSYIAHTSTNFGEITPNSSTNFGYTLVGAESNYFPNSIDMVQSRQEITEGLTIELANISNNYDTFGGQLILTNTTDEQICMPEITINTNFSLLSNWGYDIIDLGENSYTIKSKFDTGIFINIPPNSSYTLQISGSNVENPQIESFSATELVVSVEEYISRDSDGDTLPDYYENEIYSDKYNPDTDGDLLIDGYEELILETSPLLPDTDGNEVSDADEDADEDFLTNLQEFELGTDPLEPDTDEDYLIDGEEVAAGSDPFIQDTDIDGLLDGEESYAGVIYTKYGIYFDPTNPDTDGNGILDGDEKFAQNVQKEVVTSDGAITNISVEMTANGSLDNNLSVESVMGIDIMSSNLVGLVGDPFDFSTTSEFEEAKLTFTIDQTKLGDALFENLTIMWYDEENQQFVDCSQDENFTVTSDSDNGQISVITSHFSQYMVVDSNDWYEAWAYMFEKFEPEIFTEEGVEIEDVLTNRGVKWGKINSLGDVEYYMDLYKDAGISVGNSVYDYFNGHFYLIIETGDISGLTWEESKAFCEVIGGNLVTITSQEEQTFIESLYAQSSKKSYWLGATDKEKDGDWKWITGEAWGYTNWNGGEPNNNSGGESYLQFYSGTTKWNDEKDYNSHTGLANTGIICEWEINDIEYDDSGNIAFVTDKINWDDTDGDTVPNIIEMYGLKINGQPIASDPNDKHSDNDGLEDGEEVVCRINALNNTNYIYYEESLITNLVRQQNNYYASIRYSSDPTKEDGDGDGLSDPNEKYHSNPLSTDTDGDKINDFTDPTPAEYHEIKNSNWVFDWINVDIEDYMSRRSINELIILGVQRVKPSNKYHSSVMLFANSESEYYNNEYAVNSVGNIHYLTFGAGGDKLKGLVGSLTAEYNRERDVMLDIKVQMINLTTSSEINSLIPNLFQGQNYFNAHTNYDYELLHHAFKRGKTSGYNSNSYAVSLLKYSGIDDLGGPDYYVPGYQNVLPSNAFRE